MNLSIKNVPEEVVRKLRSRASRQHRSLQGELLHIVQAAAEQEGGSDVSGVLAEVRRRGIRSQSTSAEMIREDRDGR